jgi:hypothetical protein
LKALTLFEENSGICKMKKITTLVATLLFTSKILAILLKVFWLCIPSTMATLLLTLNKICFSSIEQKLKKIF